LAGSGPPLVFASHKAASIRRVFLLAPGTRQPLALASHKSCDQLGVQILVAWRRQPLAPASHKATASPDTAGLASSYRAEIRRAIA